MMTALVGFSLIGLSGLSIDMMRATAAEQAMQNAADAAALVAERMSDKPLAERQAAAIQYFRTNIAGLPNAALATVSVIEMGDGGHRVTASIPVETTISKLISGRNWAVNASSDADQDGTDLEVALVLDTSGSMAGQRITDLRAAAVDLTNILVRDEQTPYYSKVALAPYSTAVNVGAYANAVRGTPIGPTQIINADWRDGASRAITSTSNQNPVTVTSNGHGFQNGDTVRITGVASATGLNNRIYSVSSVTTNTFRLTGVNGASLGNGAGGSVVKCYTSTCEVQVRSNGHGIANGEYARISSVNGMTQINNGTNGAWRAKLATADTFILEGTNGPSYGAYTNGGSSFCTRYGCEYYRFLNANGAGSQRVNRVSTCVTERSGPHAFTSAGPDESFVGMHYPSSANPCPAGIGITPLTNDKATLIERINTLPADGWTGGQIGTAWGWYLLSPGFSELWPEASRPKPFGAPHLRKFVVIMTDGEFNAAHCNGVTARNSGIGSASDRINCDSPTGSAFDAAIDLCDAMKASGVSIYTVGFSVSNNASARALVNECASGPSNVFMASSGAELRQAFRDIATQISQLRLTR